MWDVGGVEVGDGTEGLAMAHRACTRVRASEYHVVGAAEIHGPHLQHTVGNARGREGVTNGVGAGQCARHERRV